jgi:hypothetical protein
MAIPSVEQTLSRELLRRTSRPWSPSRTGERLRWVAPAGFSLLLLTVVFLMALVVATVLGHPVPCSGRGLVVFVIALSTGGAAAFLTGSAKAEGKLPFLGHNVVTIAASGAIAAIVIVLVVGFRLFAADSICGGEPVPTDRERQITQRFWEHAFGGNWKAAYDLFPSALHAKMGFPDFVKVSSSYLSQFDGPPRSRQYEDAVVASETLIVTTLAEFDRTSTFREALKFQRQDNQWVPWEFTISPVEWPQANAYQFVSLPAGVILSAVSKVAPAERAEAVGQYAGRYIPPSGWSMTVTSVGDRRGDRTCDVNAQETGGAARLLLRGVLGGCGLRLGSTIHAVARIATVDEAITLEAIRFWR